MSTKQQKLKISEIESIVKNALGNQFVSMWKQAGTNDYIFTVNGNVEEAAKTLETTGFSVPAIHRPKSMSIATKSGKLAATFDFVVNTRYANKRVA